MLLTHRLPKILTLRRWLPYGTFCLRSPAYRAIGAFARDAFGLDANREPVRRIGEQRHETVHAPLKGEGFREHVHRCVRRPHARCRGIDVVNRVTRGALIPEAGAALGTVCAEEKTLGFC